METVSEIPETTALGDAAELIRDTVLPSDIEVVPYVGLEHIQEGTLHLSGHGWSNQVNSAKTRFRRGDILFGKLRPYFRKVIRAPFDGVCSTDIWVIRAKEGIEQDYLYYWMASEDFVDAVSKASEGTKMPRAKWEYASQFTRIVPPLAEQRRIAHILGTLDDKIELNRRMNATLEGIARAIFKSWFVDFDPVRAKAAGRPSGLPPALDALFPNRFVDSELGEIPEGWEVKGLDETADFLNGLALQKYPPKTMQESLPVIKIREMRQGYSATTDRAADDIDSKYIIEDGDLLFSWSGSLLAKFWTEGRGALNQHLFKVTSEQYPQWFYYFWLQHHMPEFQAIAEGKATTMGHIQRHHLSAALCLVPAKEAFKEFTSVIEAFVKLEISNNIEANNLSAIRDALLLKLIQGEN